MGVAIVLTIFFGLLMLFYGAGLPNNKKDEKSIFMYYGVICIMCVWSVYTLGYIGVKEKDHETLPFYVYIGIIIAIIFLIKFARGYIKKPNLKIVAPQVSYWGISPKDIEDYYNYRRDIKADRVETKVNKLSKKFYRTYSNKDKFLTGNIFLEMTNLKLLKVQKLDEINKVLLYATVFNKIKELCKQAEINANFDEILAENGYIVEYFLMDCWTRFTKPFNIGTANLEILATDFTQKELAGALDNADLNSVRRAGASLYFKYALFKGLIPQDEEEAGEDEVWGDEEGEDEVWNSGEPSETLDKRTVVFLDLETNGLDFTESTLSIYAIKFNVDNDGKMEKVSDFERYYYLLDDEEPNLKALNKNKLTREIIDEKRGNADYARHFKDDTDVADYFKGVDLAVGHNIDKFDWRRISLYFKELENISTFDTMTINEYIVEAKTNKGKHKLPNLAETAKHYGLEVDTENTHEAKYDTMLTVAIFEKMITNGSLLQEFRKKAFKDR